MFSVICAIADRGKRKMDLGKADECPRRKSKHRANREKRKMVETVVSGEPEEALTQVFPFQQETADE